MSNSIDYVMGLLKQVAAMDNKTYAIDSNREKNIAIRLVNQNCKNDEKDFMQKYIDGAPITNPGKKIPPKNESCVVKFFKKVDEKYAKQYPDMQEVQSLVGRKYYTVKYDDNGDWINTNHYKNKKTVLAFEERVKNEDGTVTERFSAPADEYEREMYYDRNGELSGIAVIWDGIDYDYTSKNNINFQYRKNEEGEIENIINKMVDYGTNTYPVYEVKDNAVRVRENHKNELSPELINAIKEHLGLDVVIEPAD